MLKRIRRQGVAYEPLEQRQLMASVSTLLQYDFNGATAWPSMAGTSSAGGSAALIQGGVGTIDTEGGTTPSGALRLTETAPTTGAWTSDLSSGQIAVTNTETNLGKLTLSFTLSASQAQPVKVRIFSYSTATGAATGGLETTIYPAAAYYNQRFAVDLSTMKPFGAGTFNPTAPFVSFDYQMASTLGWVGSQASQLRLDNVNYAKPAYYVSPNGNNTTGRTEATAFRTPQQAVNVAQPGDIILLMTGTYNEVTANTGAIKISSGGTPADWITIKNYPGQSPEIYNEAWNAILIGNGSSSAIATTPAIAYVEIRGLHIRGNADIANTAYPTALNQADPRTNGNGISIDGRYETNHPHDIRIADNLIDYNSGGGIGAGEVDRVQIENNIVQNNCWWMIYAGSGISVLSAYNFDGTSGSYTRLIRNNVTSGNQCFEKWASVGKYSDGNGIIIDVNHNTSDLPNGVTVGRTLVTDNISYNNGGGGIHAFNADHVDIINNTAYLNSASPYLQYDEIDGQNDTDVRIYNNILVAPVAAAGQPAEPVNGGNASFFKNNIYLGGNTAPIMGTGDIKADPKFVYPSIDPATANFSLQSTSPGINFGTTTLAPVIDYGYAPRYAAPDAGAIEYVPPAPTAVALATGSDTGTAGDNLTKLNNASIAGELSFVVTGTISGASVAIYSGAVLLGTATAGGTTTTVTTNGTAALPDGSASITAVQTFASAPSASSPALGISIDTASPTLVGVPVINVGAARASSRSQIRTITWTFSEPVSVGLGNFVLTNRDTGLPVSLSTRTISISGNTVTLNLDNYGVDSGPGLFLADANYALALSPTVTDSAGNALDANGDGTPGETPIFDFYKLLGSFISPRQVSTTDYLVWRAAFGHSISEGTIDPAFDMNGDGNVNTTDYVIWRSRFGNTLPTMTDGLFYN